MTILFIDSDEQWAKVVSQRLTPEHDLLWATSIGMATSLLEGHPDIKLVIIGQSEGRSTLDFLAMVLRRGYPGSIMAATASGTMNAVLVAAGCTHAVTTKEDAGESAVRLAQLVH